jgi:hypothetical protein
MKKNIAILIILTLLKSGLAYASDEAEIVSIEPGVKRIIVIPKEFDFTEEKEEFTQFRRRYVTFWTFFLLSWIIPYVW